MSQTNLKYKTGDKVIITTGPHVGKEGNITFHNNHEFYISNPSDDHRDLGKFSKNDFIHKHLTEDTNVVGSGAIAGAGVGPQGEPGVHPKAKTLNLILTAMLKRRQPIVK